MMIPKWKQTFDFWKSLCWKFAQKAPFKIETESKLIELTNPCNFYWDGKIDDWAVNIMKRNGFNSNWWDIRVALVCRYDENILYLIKRFSWIAFLFILLFIVYTSLFSHITTVSAFRVTIVKRSTLKKNL